MENNKAIKPLVGYFISREKICNIKSSGFNSIYRLFIDSARLFGGELFLFSIDDVNWGNLSIMGYTFRTGYPSQLITNEFPLPKVIYNRCFGSGSRQEIQVLISRIKSLNCGTAICPESSRHVEKAVNLYFLEPVQIIGCPSEVRLLVQKDYRGVWQFTAGATKLYPRGTKIQSAFEQYPFDSSLKEVFPGNYKKIKTSLIKKAINEAGRMEKITPNLIEAEIDLNIDKNGFSWVSKTSKNPIKKFATSFTGSLPAYLSITRPLQCCFRLAGFPLNKKQIQSHITPRELNLKPTIGIFAGSAEIEAIRSQRTDELHLMLAKAGQELNCSVYHFSLSDLEKDNTIRGWYYDHGQQKWLSNTFPWPRIFYDRATFPLKSERIKAKQFRKDLREAGATIFLNSRFVFGKGFTSEVLAKIPHLHQYLPFSVIDPSPGRVKKMLNNYGSVFIKTEYGSNQMGVMKISRQNGRYSCSNQNEEAVIGSFDRLWDKIKEEVQTDPFVAQQGIDPALYQSNPLNVRSIVQKNGNGLWEVSLVKPWIATSPYTRDRPIQWADTVANLFTQSADQIHEEICRISLIAAKALEAYSGHLGELGIDLIIDSAGHPWIIEVNGKTNKYFFIKDDKLNQHYKLFYNPLSYGCYLAKNYFS